MNKKMTKKLFAAGFLATGTLFAGCFGAGNDTTIGNTTVNNFGTGPTARKVNSAPVKPRKTAAQVILLGDQKDLLRLSLTAEGISQSEKALAGRIAHLVTGAVSADDAKVITAGKGDVRLRLKPALTVIDKSGDYYRINCEVTASLTAVNSGRVFGTKRFKLVSPRRVLGHQAAVAQFDESASTAVAQWCRSELKRIADNELGVAVLTIQLPTPPKGKSRDAAVDSAYINAIGSYLAKLPNLISYEFTGKDESAGVCQYRVAYFKSAFPNGISNEVSALLKSIVRHK